MKENAVEVSLDGIIQMYDVYWVVSNSVASMVVAQATKLLSFRRPISHAN